MMDPCSAADSERLEALRTLLDSASALLAEITGDPLFARLTQVFSQIPAAEREAIVSILEREALARATSEVATAITGLSLRLNPRARLYTRVIAEEPRPDPKRALTSALRAIRVMDDAVAPMNAEWPTIARQALRALGPAERASMARFAREILRLVEECGSESAVVNG
jgi:hypothetical protein